jgi:hypothetical protein
MLCKIKIARITSDKDEELTIIAHNRGKLNTQKLSN